MLPNILYFLFCKRTIDSEESDFIYMESNIT